MSSTIFDLCLVKKKHKSAITKKIANMEINRYYASCCTSSITDHFTKAWIRIRTPIKVWVEITYPFSNFNGCTVEVWEWIIIFFSHFIMGVIPYPCQNLS